MPSLRDFAFFPALPGTEVLGQFLPSLCDAVVFVGAAGMFAFENDNADGRGLDYPAALWWTAMMVTTIGSDYWPQTVEGRVLCLVLALYAFAVFGYVAATLSSFFIERDAESPQAALVGARAVEEVQRELAALRAEIRVLLKDGAAREAENSRN